MFCEYKFVALNSDFCYYEMALRGRMPAQADLPALGRSNNRIEKKEILKHLLK